MSTSLSICNDWDSHSSAPWVTVDLCTLIIVYRRAQLGNPTIPRTNPKVPRLLDSFFVFLFLHVYKSHSPFSTLNTGTEALEMCPVYHSGKGGMWAQDDPQVGK